MTEPRNLASATAHIVYVILSPDLILNTARFETFKSYIGHGIDTSHVKYGKYDAYIECFGKRDFEFGNSAIIAQLYSNNIINSE